MTVLSPSLFFLSLIGYCGFLECWPEKKGAIVVESSSVGLWRRRLQEILPSTLLMLILVTNLISKPLILIHPTISSTATTFPWQFHYWYWSYIPFYVSLQDEIRSRWLNYQVWVQVAEGRDVCHKVDESASAPSHVVKTKNTKLRI
jgi:hypothetical protein